MAFQGAVNEIMSTHHLQKFTEEKKLPLSFKEGKGGEKKYSN